MLWIAESSEEIHPMRLTNNWVTSVPLRLCDLEGACQTPPRRGPAVRQFSLSADARELLRADLLSKPVEGNARHVRNLVEDAKRKHGTRVECQDLTTREDLTTLTVADFSRI
jgi:hypothetical protein